MSHLAVGTKRTKSTEIELTNSVPGMLIATQRPVLTESTRIPRTLSQLRVRIDVKVKAFRVMALPVLCEEPAIRHLFQVILVQELTVVSFLAQATEPVLTDDSLFSSIPVKSFVGVFLGTCWSEEAGSPQEHSAYLS